jgi:hypothetical protein
VRGKETTPPLPCKGNNILGSPNAALEIGRILQSQIRNPENLDWLFAV